MNKHLSASTVGLGCCFALLFIAVCGFVGVAFWSWIIMLAVGAAKPAWGWGYWHSMFPWGVVAGLVLGSLQSAITRTSGTK